MLIKPPPIDMGDYPVVIDDYVVYSIGDRALFISYVFEANTDYNKPMNLYGYVCMADTVIDTSYLEDYSFID